MPKRTDNKPTVWKRKDGRWGYSVTIGYKPNGHPLRIQGTARTKAEAEQAWFDEKARLHLGVPKGRSRQRLSEFLDRWLKDAVEGKKAPKTVRYYEQMVRLYIVPYLGRMELRAITGQHVQALLSELLKKGLSPTTVRHVHATLRRALQTAWKWNLVAENAAAKADPPSMASLERSFLTAEEAVSLLKACQGHYLENLFILALNTGLRIGEATGLRWQDVAEDFSQIRVAVQLQHVGGKTLFKEPKSASGRRAVPLTTDAAEALRNQRANQLLWAAQRPEGFNPHGLVFTGEEGNPLDHKNVNKWLKRFAERAQIKKRLSFHALRHTVATHLVSSGVPLNTAKEILGHSQVSLTADLYSHAIPSAHLEAMKTLGRAYRVKES